MGRRRETTYLTTKIGGTKCKDSNIRGMVNIEQESKLEIDTGPKVMGGISEAVSNGEGDMPGGW